MTKTLSDTELVAELVAALRHALKLLEPFDDPDLALGLGSNALAPIRAALSAAEAASVGEKDRCKCGAMSAQDCHDLPNLRHCGGAEATSAGERSNDPLGTLKCQHKECGRFWDVRAWSCRAMADNACARHDAPTPAPVSGEREELAKHWDEMAAFGKLQYEQCLAAGVERDVARIHLDISAKQERTAALLRTPHGLPGEALKFRKEHYGATVATLIDTEDTIVEISARPDGDYELIVHNREGERDTFRDCSALLKPKHFAALGTLANRLSPASREDGKNG